MSPAPAPLLPAPRYRRFRVALLRWACRIVIGGLLRIRLEGRQRLAAGPAIYCFNHLNWVDPLVLMAVLPVKPHYAMFGPKEADMQHGGRNRLIAWSGFGIPYRPAKTDLLETTRRVTRVLDDGWVILIAGEGRIHRGERELLREHRRRQGGAAQTRSVGNANLTNGICRRRRPQRVAQ